MPTLCPYQQHGSWGGVHDGRGNAAEISRKAGWKSDRPSGIHPRCVSYGGEEGLDMERLRMGYMEQTGRSRRQTICPMRFTDMTGIRTGCLSYRGACRKSRQEWCFLKSVFF